jgi:hypothetical protein
MERQAGHRHGEERKISMGLWWKNANEIYLGKV